MSNSNFIIQQNDSINIVKKDSNVPFLELIKAVDSSDLIVTKKKVKKNSPVAPVVSPPPATSQVSTDTLVQDSTFFELGNTTNIPIRKTIKQKTTTVHEQSKITFEPTLKISNNKTWPSIILTISLLLLAFTKAFGASRIRQIYKSLFSYYSAYEVVREEKVFFHQVNFILFLVYILTLSLLLFFVASLLDAGSVTPTLYPILLGGVIVAYAFKFIFTYLIAYLFDFSQHLTTYSYNVLLYNYLMGFLLIPSLALIYFSKFDSVTVLQTIIVPLICIILLIRFIRFFVIGISNKISYFYIILYICTLEILPLVVLGKFFIF